MGVDPEEGEGGAWHVCGFEITTSQAGTHTHMNKHKAAGEDGGQG